MGTVSLGKIAFSYKGSYTGATTYFRQDVVSLNGDSYICLVDNTVGMAPINNPAKWQLFAQGTSGVSSAAGELVYNSGGALAALAPGVAGQVLTVGANGLPVWGTPDVRSGTKFKRLLENASTKVNNRPYRRFGGIMTDNSVRMWGNNDNYVLGDGNTFARPYPVRVAFGPGFPGAAKVYVDYNYSGYCIDLNGQLWSWGYNGYGQLGLNDTADRRVPVNASLVASSSIFGRTVTEVIVAGGVEGYSSVMVICADGSLHSAGYNGYGQLGLGDTTQRNQFVQVPVVSNVVAARLGRERYTAAYVVQADGKLYSWGYNGDGQLGDGTTTQANIPVQRTGGTLSGKTISNVYCGHSAAYALDSTGRLHAWGTNTTYGNLGCGNFANQFTPVQVAIGVADVYTNSYDYPMVLIRKTDGTLWGAGAGNYSANGNVAGNHTADFAQIAIGNTVTKAAIGGTGSYNYCLALMQNGTVYAWGYNGNGALGVGDSTNRLTPVLVPIALRTVQDIAVYGTSSEQCSAFLFDDGQLCVAGYGGSYANTDNNGNWIGTPYPVIL